MSETEAHFIALVNFNLLDIYSVHRLLLPVNYPLASFFHSGTIDDCELVEGLVLTQKVANSGISRVEKAKIGLIQFCLSAPKTDVSRTR